MGLGGTPELALDLIGPIALRRDGEACGLPASRKTRALLGYLAVAQRPVRRDHLCDLLWEVPDDPRGALRWSLSKLRPLVDTNARARLIAGRDAVALDCAGVAVDWLTLRSVAEGDLLVADTAAIEDALRAEGSFLEGADLPSCERFQAWLVAMREDTRLGQVKLLRELAKRINDPAHALALVRRLCALDPFDAGARSTLVELLEREGRLDEAEQQRAAAVRALGEADIAAPDKLIRRQSPPAAAPPAPAAAVVQQVRFCTAKDGTGLAYSAIGNGPPLVKTANWLNHLEYDLDSPVWRHWVHELTGYRTLVRYDERGNGLSDWNAEAIHFDAFVDDLSSVVDAAGLERFDLLGVSQGCSVAIAYAVRNPERVGRLVLYGGYASGWKVRGTAQEREMREAMLTLTRTGWGSNNPAFRQIFTSLFFPEMSAEESEWFNELQRMSASAENAERLQNAFSEIDVRALLADVRAPTLVLHADRDAVIPFAQGRMLATGIPEAQFVSLESCNHLVLEGDPAWGKAAAAIRAFLG